MNINKSVKNGVIVYSQAEKPRACRLELSHQVDLINLIRFNFPQHSKLMFHPTNEGKHTAFHRSRQIKEGMLAGVSDIICLSRGANHSAFICELKQPKLTYSSVNTDQRLFLEGCHGEGLFSCVAFGAAAGWRAWCDYIGVTDHEIIKKADHIAK